MRNRNPFSSRLEGPRTTAEIAVEREWRERGREQQPPSGFEHILTLGDLWNYFEQKGISDHEDFCSPFSCDIWKVEDVLLRDLDAARDPDEVNRLRGLIRAASWMNHDRPAKNELLMRAHAIKNAYAFKRREEARTDAWEAKEWDEEIARADQLVDAIEHDRFGEEARSAAAAMDIEFSRAFRAYERTRGLGKAIPRKMREKLRADVESLRPLRDCIYFQHLYPTWFKAGLTSRPER